MHFIVDSSVYKTAPQFIELRGRISLSVYDSVSFGSERDIGSPLPNPMKIELDLLVAHASKSF